MQGYKSMTVDMNFLYVLCVQEVAGEDCHPSFGAVGENEHNFPGMHVIDMAIHDEIDTAAGNERF